MTVFAGEGYPSSEVMLRDVNAYLIRHGARPLERVRKTPCGKPVCDNAYLSITHTGTKNDRVMQERTRRTRNGIWHAPNK